MTCTPQTITYKYILCAYVEKDTGQQRSFKGFKDKLIILQVLEFSVLVGTTIKSTETSS